MFNNKNKIIIININTLHISTIYTMIATLIKFTIFKI